MVNYKLIRSNRKTLGLEITEDLSVLVRSPLKLPVDKIDEFVSNHSNWIEKHLALAKNRNDGEMRRKLSLDQQNLLIQQALRVIPAKVKYYSEIMGVAPTAVKITSAKKRFGSCSGKNSLCFSFRVMLYPEAAIEYVVVHELAHIKEKNHGKNFYAVVRTVLPDYKEREKMFRG
ncbi:MAG TPA: M48 family metallopeptidase [Clostridiales bacterium]|nr:M48 family metallopeptidase [Clostridiales bacterium]